MMDTCQYGFVTPTECTMPTVNFNVNYGISVIIVNVSSSIITNFPFWG